MVYSSSKCRYDTTVYYGSICRRVTKYTFRQHLFIVTGWKHDQRIGSLNILLWVELEIIIFLLLFTLHIPQLDYL